MAVRKRERMLWGKERQRSGCVATHAVRKEGWRLRVTGRAFGAGEKRTRDQSGEDAYRRYEWGTNGE